MVISCFNPFAGWRGKELVWLFVLDILTTFANILAFTTLNRPFLTAEDGNWLSYEGFYTTQQSRRDFTFSPFDGPCIKW